MTASEKQIEMLLFVAMCKMLAEQSTRMIGEIDREAKMYFNNVVKPAEMLTRLVEKDLNEYDLKTLEILTDSFHDGIAGLRKELFDSIKKP